MLDEIDHQIVHALQIAPRASWGMVAKVLGISAVTASRHWERLVVDGLAWVIAYPGPSLFSTWCSAWIDISCEPGARDEVVRVLSGSPLVATIQSISGERTLLVTVMTHDLGALSTWVRTELRALDGIRDIRTRVVTRIYGESIRWRVGVLSPAQQQVLREDVPALREVSGRPRDDELRLMAALARDGRRAAVDLAAETGISAPTVRRRLDRLTGERMLSLRCEVAHVLNGWPVTATLWARVPATALDAVGKAIANDPDVRVCCATSGSSNLVMTVWLRHVSELQSFEAELERKFSMLSVVNREITLDTPKRLGAVLDDQGRRIDSVPIALEPG